MVNIFFLSKDPKKCASYYCDKHVSKIAIEIAQILCNIHQNLGYDAPYKKCKAIKQTQGVYKWILESVANYKYSAKLGLALIDEYFYRYDKNEHRTKPVLEWCLKNIPKEIPEKKMTKFKLSHRIEAFDKISTDPVLNSKFLYVELKCNGDKWSKRKVPEWFNILNEYNEKHKMKLRNKLEKLVGETLPKLSKTQVYRNHSFRRVIYDTLLRGVWNIKAKSFASYDKDKSLVSYLTLPNLYCALEIGSLLKNQKTLKELNNLSLFYRKKMKNYIENYDQKIKIPTCSNMQLNKKLK
ncbi:MAG: hypothetical protein CMF62_00590 [Magnetococcales bacterium]|nr:hypothetical protein [Magnetococcales bacterium]|tara:strand:- start:12472 stop:13359 length:888 start_codon:yes stop_codon:yes gene_type:complete